MKLTPFTLRDSDPSARSIRAVPTALCAISIPGRSPIWQRHNVAATESEAVVEDSLQEAVCQSNGRRQFSPDFGSNPNGLAVHRSIKLRSAARLSSSGRARGHESSATILNAVMDASLQTIDSPLGAGYAPRGRLIALARGRGGCCPADPGTARSGSKPAQSAHRNQSVRSAQQQESATRLASEDNHASGSAAAQPVSIVRAA